MRFTATRIDVGDRLAVRVNHDITESASLGLEIMSTALSIEVRGDLIIVAQGGTSFSATYGKAKDEPNVVLLAFTEGRDAEPRALSKFRADAFIAATNKSRELGWIV